MADISNLLPAGLESLGVSAGNANTKDRNELGQDEFFELMIAQLQNQDPLKPLESNEFMGQVAQFSTVNGIQSMEQSINQLAGSLQSSQALQASMLVGRDVLVPGDAGILEQGGSLSGAIDLSQSVGQSVIGIYSTSGQLVRQLDLGAQAAGLAQFKWDGLDSAGNPAPAGIYGVRAEASFDGANEAVPSFITARVDSVTLNPSPQGPTLNLGVLGEVAISNVRQLL